MAEMSRKKYSPEQIIIHLREVEVLCNQGNTIAEAAR
jgi:putative transposase